MRELLIRCSSIGKLMTEPKTKAEGPLSVGAKTHIRSLVAQDIFGVDFEISSKEMEKGNLVEPDGIALLNRVRGLDLAKNTERRSNGWITGECDLFNAPARRGHDLKCSWSVATFPIATIDCEDKFYEWQMRGYMWLWDADEWEVNYALLSTPEHLVRYEPASMHFVDHIPEHLRLTTCTVTRDRTKEEQMAEKVKAARDYYAIVLHEFTQSHPERFATPIVRAEESAKLEREQAAREAAAKRAEQAIAQDAMLTIDPAVVNMTDIPTPQEAASRILAARLPEVQKTSPTLRLGQICERLGFTVTADFLRSIGFEPAANDRRAMLYHEEDFPYICAALIAHIKTAQAKQAA